MKKNSGSIRYSGAHTSPGTPEFGDITAGEIPKSWCSERVPLPSNSRRHISASALIPFNSGRTVPSKWDEAERWITSPSSGHGSVRTPIAQPQRQPKSKSGPLGRSGLVYLSNYSPTNPTLEGGKIRNFMENSPLTTGVLVPEGLSIHYDAGIAAKSSSLYANTSLSTGVPGLSDLVTETSVPSSQDDKHDGAKEEEALASKVVCRGDMATQMNPEGSSHSSSKGRFSFSATTSSIPALLRPHGNPSGKDEVRDVQVDKGTTTVRQPKNRGQRKTKENATDIEDSPLSWNHSGASKNTSKLQREEAKITSWENLQKAKAEASIRKLEMKLEKKRSASMDKIMNKVRAAEMKAETMRNSLSEDQPSQSPPTSHGRISFCMHVKAYSLRNCFLCRGN